MPKDLLYEIGVEEIPASFVIPALEQLERGLREGLGDLRLQFGDIQTFGTPRRLSIIVRGISERQPDVEEERKGPPADRAFDSDGKPTKAAEGFARKNGVSVDDLRVVETDKGRWVAVTVLQAGQAAEEVLPALLTELTLGLSFPKTMRWADLDLRFARPIRWLLAILDGRTLPMEIGGVKSGNRTRGHRLLGSSAIEVPGADAYAELLHQNYVLADIDGRREAIRRAAMEAAQEVGGVARIDDRLLTEVSFLVEWPTCLWGRFDAKFLALPDAVVVTVMQGHQKYFPVEDTEGNLLPYFVTVRNGDEEGLDTVRAGNEKVIVPRLADAEFYLTEDLKHTLDERAQSLSRVTFMEGMGTLADKTRRLEQLVGHLGAELREIGTEVVQAATRAAQLAKADLVTLMVGDSKLGELQGIIGGEYASRLGESEAVATAVAEQYRPRGAGDPPPQSPAGTLLAIADKMDNLAACFRLGMAPTGSTDPFALRRQAQGIVEILMEADLQVDLRALVARALQLLPEPQLEKPKDAERVLDPQAAAEALLGFFSGRLDFILTRDGITYDVSRAVLNAPWSDALEVYRRARFIQSFRDQEPEPFDRLVTAAERPARICRGEQLPAEAAPDTGLFEGGYETALWEAAQAARAVVEEALAADPANYRAAAEALAGLLEPIHQFFDEIMVMVDDAALRTNRLVMLREIDLSFQLLADFTHIVREG